MRKKCSKCKTVATIAEMRTEGGRLHKFCKICSLALANDDRTMNLDQHFLQDDFGDFPISEVQKDIINARKARAEGKSPWRL